MLAWEVFKHYLLSKRSEALIRVIARLCIMGVGVGVMSLVIVLSVMAGFKDSIRNKLLAVEPHLMVYHNESERSLVEGWMKAQGGIELSPFEQQDVILRTVEGVFGGAVAKGLPADALHALLQRVDSLLKGNKNVDSRVASDTKLNPGEVIMGIDLARSLGVYEGDEVVVIPPESLLLPPGETPPYQKLKVRSLLATHVQDVDKGTIFYVQGESLRRFQRAASKEIGTQAWLEDPDDLARWEALFDKKKLKSETWVDRNKALFFALKMEKTAMTVFLGLSALITSFSIVTVLVLLMSQKRGDIGILMSMGLSARRTRWLFMQVGLFLSLVGMGGGLVLGLLVAFILDRFPVDVLPDIYYDSSIPATIEMGTVVFITFMALFIAILGAWLPVRRYIRMSPAEALSRSQS